MNGSLVDAIEEGKIVRVSEDYARREGLPILRKAPKEDSTSFSPEEKKNSDEDHTVYGVDEYRKPLGWKEQQVISELIDNFHWSIAKARRERNMSRKHFADGIGVSEQQVKLIENGILPSKDFILVNKIQDFLGINLRKDGMDHNKLARDALDEEIEQVPKENLDITGEDIEFFEE